MGREVPLVHYRGLVRLLTLVSVVLITLAVYLVIPPSHVVWAAVAGSAGVSLFLVMLRFGIQSDERAATTLIFVNKRDCTLCHESRTRLAPLAALRGLEVRDVWIDDDSRLRRQYADWVPVIVWQGHEVAKGRFEWVELERRLDAIVRRS